MTWFQGASRLAKISETSMKRRLLYAALLLAALLHHDFWFWNDRTLFFGVLPVGLMYHIVYTLAVVGLMWLLAEHAWPAHLDKDAPSPTSAPEETP